MKTLDVQAKEWYDKSAGNSYFSVLITIDFGYPTQREIKLPFQYGYESQYEFESLKTLIERGYFKKNAGTSLSRVCREAGVILNSSKLEKCKQKDVKAWGLN